MIQLGLFKKLRRESLPPSPSSISNGKGGSAILYPTPAGIPFGATGDGSGLHSSPMSKKGAASILRQPPWN